MNLVYKKNIMYGGGHSSGASYKAGDGISIQDDTISVSVPVKGMTQAEYDALGDSEKNSGFYIITDGELAVSPISETKLYSTSEVNGQIGTWIDGSPLYRETLLLTSPSEENKVVQIGSIPSNYIVVESRGSLRGANDEYMPVPWNLNNETFGVYFIDSNGAIMYSTLGSQFIDCPFTLTIDYIKRDDSPASQTNKIKDPDEIILTSNPKVPDFSIDGTYVSIGSVGGLTGSQSSDSNFNSSLGSVAFVSSSISTSSIGSTILVSSTAAASSAYSIGSIGLKV